MHLGQHDTSVDTKNHFDCTKSQLKQPQLDRVQIWHQSGQFIPVDVKEDNNGHKADEQQC